MSCILLFSQYCPIMEIKASPKVFSARLKDICVTKFKLFSFSHIYLISEQVNQSSDRTKIYLSLKLSNLVASLINILVVLIFVLFDSGLVSHCHMNSLKSHDPSGKFLFTYLAKFVSVSCNQSSE